MSFRSDAFENPVLQQHFRNLEALALDMMAPEDIEDLISKKKIKSFLFTYHCLIWMLYLFLLFISFFTSVPKVDQIDQRLGSLVEEFKDLVYPDGYNPESKPAPKRKTGQIPDLVIVPIFQMPCLKLGHIYLKKNFLHAAEAGGGAEKKPKVEVTQDELKAHFQNGTLGKLTVPVLKEACKQFGIKTTGTKKQDLIDALSDRLGP